MNSKKPFVKKVAGTEKSKARTRSSMTVDNSSQMFQYPNFAQRYNVKKSL